MDADAEDFVFYGTPIGREEDLTSRKKKSVAEAAGQLRSLPHWKQEVRDEDGRRRLHGAFTGGFSAGYFNTVGSKEGWTPQTFTSSRKNRAEVKQQDILNFLDEDEKEELEGRSLGTSSQFDTFGFTAAEVVRKQVEKEQQQRPSAIPGPVPDELVLPAAESIGVKLLLKMGWRRGHSIKESRANVQYNARREARRAFLAFSSDDATKLANSEAGMDTLGSFSEEPLNDNVQSSIKTPVYVLNPKQDVYGLGYDPYKHAPEFREIKRSRISGNRGGSRDRKALSMKESLFGSKSGKAAPGFGIGALEEYDAEDEDIYAHAYDFEETHVQDDEEYPRSTTDHMQKLAWKEHHEGLRGFRVASNFDYQLERFDPPSIPKDFVPQHKFHGPPEVENKFAIPPPPEVPPPTDSNLKVLIEGVATLVARCGKLFEDLSRQKNQSNPLFSFLNGGNGQEYYVRKLWEEQQKHNGQKKLALDGKSSPSAQKMTAETRGKILGERPLERTSKEVSSPVASGDVILNLHLSDAFTMPASFNELPEVAKPFKNDPVKQERFERFLKEKYQGGLRSTEAGGSSNMSEAARARERLDFEAAAEAIEKGKWNKETSLFTPQTLEFAGAGGMLFTSGGQEAKDVHAEDLMTKKTYPKREEFQWRPSPILCKRFDLIDPYMGKPPPPPRVRSRIDSLTFTSDSKASKVKETVMVNTVLQSGVPEITKDVLNEEPEVEVQVEKVERPVDLYKAIFSDDSDDEVEVSSSVKKGEDPDKKIEVAHTALNRLIAGDFLESLGKELGLEVPPDMPYPNSKARSSGPQKETEGSADKNGNNILSVESKAYNTPNGHSMSAAVYHQEVSGGVEAQKNDSVLGNTIGGSSKRKEHGPSDYKSGKLDLGLMVQEDGKSKSAPSRQRKRSYSSSSEDDRSRKHSKPHRYRSSDSGSDSSSDYRDRHRSKSKGRKKRSSQEKRSSSSSRKHSKHGKYESRESPSRSHYSAVEERVARKEKHRRRRD